MKLLDVCECIVDCPHSTAQDEGNGYPLIRTPNVGKGRLKLEGVHRVSIDTYNKRNERAIPQENDLILAREAPVGNVAVIKHGQKVCLGQRTVLIRPNKELVDPDFLVYYLLSPELQHRLLSSSNGATVSHLNMSAIRTLEIELPDLHIQKKISYILARIDDKIELNTEINKNLEQQAQALFKAWFVDFEPFGGVMPDDWQTKPIAQLDVLVTDYVANGSFKSLAQNVEYQSEETDNVLIRLTDYNNNYSSDMVYITDSAYDFLSKSKLYGDEIIISNVGVNVGTVFRCPHLNKRMSLAPNSIMLRSDLLEHYLYLHFTSQYGQQQLQSIVTGSAQPKFNKTNFRSLSVLLPNRDVLERFNAIYTPIYNLSVTNFTETQCLATLRNTLLPKLMNGEIDVSAIKV